MIETLPCSDCGGSGYGPDRVDGPGDVYQLRCEACRGFGCAEPFPIEAAIVRDIEIDILDRRGLKWEYRQLDDEILRQVRQAWIAIIRKHIAAGGGA